MESDETMPFCQAESAVDRLHTVWASGQSAPLSESALLQRARALTGRSLGELAALSQTPLPSVPLRGKGHVGALIERLLGADAGNRAAADFIHLGIELKTIPLNRVGRPRESTFVSMVPRRPLPWQSWEQSSVRCKLRRVLWIPVESAVNVPLGERRIGRPQLWSPNEYEEACLRQDWEELMGMLALAGSDAVVAHAGRCLQLRPKARDSSVRVRYVDEAGLAYWGPPKAFYLRARFTQQILAFCSNVGGGL